MSNQDLDDDTDVSEAQELVPWDELEPDEHAMFDDMAQAAIDAAGVPEVQIAACALHEGADHVQVRTWGNWMCVPGLTGLAGGRDA